MRIHDSEGDIMGNRRLPPRDNRGRFTRGGGLPLWAGLLIVAALAYTILR